MIPTGLPDLSKPSRVQNSIRKPEFLNPKFLYKNLKFSFFIVLLISYFLFCIVFLVPVFLSYIKHIGFKNSGFLMEFWTLDGLERSGRPVGIISTYFRQKRSGGFRVMTKKLIIFTTIKFTSIKV